jgi:hypothetical protein
MTKKILHAPGSEGAKSEFLIPVETESGFVLVGVKTGNEYIQGMVVYTGKEITPNMLKEKAKEAGVEINDGLFETYLSQMPNFKISKMVGVKQGSEFYLEYA